MSGIAEEKAFVRGIERRFLALRGGGLVLSPRDFGLLVDWFHRGLPAELVTGAIAEVLEKAEARGRRPRIFSIAYCRHAVEDAWEERRRALVGAEAPKGEARASAMAVEEVAEHLGRAAASLRAAALLASPSLREGGALRPEPPGAGSERPERGSDPPRPGSGPSGGTPAPGAGRASEGPRSESTTASGRAALTSPSASAVRALDSIAEQLLERRKGVLAQPPATFAALEDDLVRLEGEVLRAARSLLSQAELEEITTSTTDRIAPFAARMSDAARSATIGRAVDSAIRARLNLPRLSLFAIAR